MLSPKYQVTHVHSIKVSIRGIQSDLNVSPDNVD